MCGIIVTNDAKQLYNMYQANASRGSHSYSFCTFDEHFQMLTLDQELGHLSAGKLWSMIDAIPEAKIFVMHNQAPTTEARSIENIHPYYNEKHLSYTWHNGILKPSFVARFADQNSWDTALLSEFLNDFDQLSRVDGSFAFVHYFSDSQEMFIGRNELCPLYYKGIGDTFYISSVPVDNDYKNIPANIVYELSSYGELCPHQQFKTYEMPYYLGEE